MWKHKVVCVKDDYFYRQNKLQIRSDSYITPEGKFDVVLLGHSRFDSSSKEIFKEFLTNETEHYSSAKSPIGMFEELEIPNDLGLVLQKINEYYN